MRNHYWSSSKFADWLRGTASPTAETSKGWREWTARAKQAHPVRYWLADDGLNYLQNFIFYIPDKGKNIVQDTCPIIFFGHTLILN